MTTKGYPTFQHKGDGPEHYFNAMCLCLAAAARLTPEEYIYMWVYTSRLFLSQTPPIPYLPVYHLDIVAIRLISQFACIQQNPFQTYLFGIGMARMLYIVTTRLPQTAAEKTYQMEEIVQISSGDLRLFLMGKCGDMEYIY